MTRSADGCSRRESVGSSRVCIGHPAGLRRCQTRWRRGSSSSAPIVPHSAGNDASPAREMAASILQERSGGPRLNRNALVFAAADTARLDELRAAARSYLAWKSIWDEKEELNLDELSRRQAETQRDHFDETVNQRMNETFVWTLVPSQAKRIGRRDLGGDQGDRRRPVAGARLEEARTGRAPVPDDSEASDSGWSSTVSRSGRAITSRRRRSGRTSRSTCTCRVCATARCSCRRSRVASRTSAGSRTPSPTRKASTRRADGTWGSWPGRAQPLLIDGLSVVVKPEAARRQLDRGAAMPEPAGPATGHGAWRESVAW